MTSERITGSVTAVSLGSSPAMREITIPFAEGLLGAAREAGWSTQAADIRIGVRVVQLPSGHGLPIASIGHHVTIGFFAIVASGVLEAAASDLYGVTLKWPVTRLLQRMRTSLKPLHEPLCLRAETWFVPDQVIVRVEVVLQPETASSREVTERCRTEHAAAVEFIAVSVEAGDPESSSGEGEPRVVRIEVNVEGTRRGPLDCRPPSRDYAKGPRIR